MKVLLIIPDTSVRQTLERLLEFEGYDVFKVNTKEEALELNRVKRFGLVLMDPLAESISSEEFIEGLPKDHAPIGLVSDSPRLERLGKALDVDFCIHVPFDPEEFLGHVEAIARVQGMMPQPMGNQPVVLH